MGGGGRGGGWKGGGGGGGGGGRVRSEERGAPPLGNRNCSLLDRTERKRSGAHGAVFLWSRPSPTRAEPVMPHASHASSPQTSEWRNKVCCLIMAQMNEERLRFDRKCWGSTGSAPLRWEALHFTTIVPVFKNIYISHWSPNIMEFYFKKPISNRFVQRVQQEEE